MGSSYLNYCDSLKKKWFKPYGEVTEEERANVPPGLEKDDWNCLVDLWARLYGTITKNLLSNLFLTIAL